MMGKVTYLNGVAEKMTGWSKDEAFGKPLAEVFRIIDGVTRREVTGSHGIGGSQV
jgi:PAS domain-containing protein